MHHGDETGDTEGAMPDDDSMYARGQRVLVFTELPTALVFPVLAFSVEIARTSLSFFFVLRAIACTTRLLSGVETAAEKLVARPKLV